jgi:hypothetical protein
MDSVDQGIFNETVTDQLATEPHVFDIPSLAKYSPERANEWIVHPQDEKGRRFFQGKARASSTS